MVLFQDCGTWYRSVLCAVGYALASDKNLFEIVLIFESVIGFSILTCLIILKLSNYDNFVSGVYFTLILVQFLQCILING